MVINYNNNFAPSLFRSLCEFVGDCFGPRYFSSGAAIPQKNSSVQNNHLRFHTMTSKKMVRSYHCLIVCALWSVLRPCGITNQEGIVLQCTINHLHSTLSFLIQLFGRSLLHPQQMWGLKKCIIWQSMASLILLHMWWLGAIFFQLT